ncbi:MAG: ethanolamine ammonia-lyase reactivating factor EutA [Candidatus Hodarchaeales archaeon]|jgi:ethanolamine utilization protein EutA
MTIRVAEKRINSVGIDIGTSTSHLIFSELVLKKDPSSNTEKFFVAERIIKFHSQIIFTPLLTSREIDIEKLLPALLDEYKKAGISPSDIDSGAVIITGESAKKENAERIVQVLAKETGNFVASTAGPNFESSISGHGSGAVTYSELNQCKLIHTDVGGGTSNIAVIDKGRIIATACINVGGRLIAFDNDRIIRIEPAGQLVLDECGIQKGMGDEISQEEKTRLSKQLASALLETLRGQNLSEFTQKLMMTEYLPLESFSGNPAVSFSGGVAEYIYQKTEKDYNDLGKELGFQIRTAIKEDQFNQIETPEKIRATVIGASGHTLNVSGSTTFISEKVSNTMLPMKNLPIAQPQIQREKLSIDYVALEIKRALQRVDIIEGYTPFVLAFDDPVRTVYKKLTIFSEGIVKALPNSIKNNKPILMIFSTDIGNSVGSVMKRETGIKNEILSLDEIAVKEGEFIDVGTPLFENRVFPVVVKSLIFG